MASTMRWAGKVGIYLDMIKFPHILFALPFAYLGLWLAERGWPRFSVFLWVTLAMVGMRTAAMSINRLVDRKIDRVNPRTEHWALARGLISVSAVWLLAILAVFFYFYSAYKLNPLCLVLSPLPPLLAVIYPYLKRFTWFCHFLLGIIIGIAPAAGWIASRGSISRECWILFFAVAAWVTGFDMIYSLQDLEFDRRYGLSSFPAKFGLSSTLGMTRILHLVTLMALAGLGWVAHLGIMFWFGSAIVAYLLFKEHWLIVRFGLSAIDKAFFQMNASISVVLFLATALDLS